MKKYLKFFFKPSIKSSLVNGGKQVKVTISNAKQDEVMIMLFLSLKQIAISMKIDPRHLMNKIIDLDKSIERSAKHMQKKPTKLTLENNMTLAIIIMVLYFAPSITGYMNKKKNKAAILTLNFFLGWTVIGWVVALTWATMKD